MIVTPGFAVLKGPRTASNDVCSSPVHLAMIEMVPETPRCLCAPPAVLAQSKTGAVTNGPVQIYHLGVWFNTPADAVKAGCPGTATTFTSNHDAGIQVLNTATFPDDAGPLFRVP